MKQPNDKWIRIINPLLLIIISGLAQQALVPPFTTGKIFSLCRLVVFIILTFEAGRLVVIISQKKLPQLFDTKRRIAWSLIITLFTSFILITCSTLLSRLYIPKSSGLSGESFINFIQCIWISFIAVAPYEVLYTYYLSVMALKEKEVLSRANTEAQLSLLQQQVNPHFLFNSLNVLAALTAKDPNRAEAYILEMSTVYRYLLTNNTERLMTLDKELVFIRSYLNLMMTRFENGLQVQIDIDEQYKSYYIPPLSLQILVENVIQHNEMIPANPILIRIFSVTDGRLIITNTLRKKRQPLYSSKTGLSGIIQRYQLLKQPPVIINETANEFSVELALIKEKI